MVEQWEYKVRLLDATTSTPGALEYIRERELYPSTPPIYAPEAMEPTLDALGAEGWELVHMEPVPKVGRNRDVGFATGSDGSVWSHTYFCVFKRRRLTGVERAVD